MTPWKPLPALVASLIVAPACLAETCDAVKGHIDSKIQVAGVAHYTLSIVDMGAAAPGKTVGTCGGGKQRIVYAALAAPGPATAATSPGKAAAAAPGSAPVKPRHPPILTECKDGSVGWDCGKPK